MFIVKNSDNIDSFFGFTENSAPNSATLKP